MAKQSLNTKQAKSDKEAQTLGAIIGSVGETIGNYDAARKLDQDTVIEIVEEFLRDAMKHGLHCDKDKGDMLKAPSKSNPGELYTILVEAINEPRINNGLDPISVRSRDNYMSRIRAFVRNRGVDPLDLFGNLATKKAEQERKLAAEKAKAAVATAQDTAKHTETNAPSEESAKVHDSDKPAAINAKGLIALRDFLGAFIVQNDEPDASPDMEFVLGACDELMQSVKKIIANKGKKGKAKEQLLSIDQII